MNKTTTHPAPIRRRNHIIAAATVLLGFALLAEARFDPELMAKVRREALGSAPAVRDEVLGTLEVYEDLPEKIPGGAKIPAAAGHPLLRSPLVPPSERDRAANLVIPLMTAFRGANPESPRDLEESLNKFEHHMAHLPQPASLQDKYNHIVNCPACGPFVSHMIFLHEEAVADAPRRELILFETARSEIQLQYNSLLSSVAATVKRDPSLSVCLIGRASRTGSWQFNQRLSRARAERVASALNHFGVAPERIQTLWLGFDAPQLLRRNTEKYDLYPVYARCGALRANQSVLIVVYRR